MELYWISGTCKVCRVPTRVPNPQHLTEETRYQEAWVFLCHYADCNHGKVRHTFTLKRGQKPTIERYVEGVRPTEPEAAKPKAKPKPQAKEAEKPVAKPPEPSRRQTCKDRSLERAREKARLREERRRQAQDREATAVSK